MKKLKIVGGSRYPDIYPDIATGLQPTATHDGQNLGHQLTTAPHRAHLTQDEKSMERA